MNMDKIKLIETLKQLDAYSKPIEDFQEKTFFGGTVSILCRITITVLVIQRCYEYFTIPEITESIFVDTSRGSSLRINMEIIFPQISCDYLSLDAMDSSGEQHLHINHSIFKRRLDLNGRPIEEPVQENIGPLTSDTSTKNASETGLAKVKCGSCYGAEDESFNITCCNTCDEVKEAYRLKRWQLIETDVAQCKSSATAKQIENAFKEGCEIYGFMEVNRVGGSFHIAPGQSFSINHVHVHDVQPFSSSSFNTSHQIRHLSFTYGEAKTDLLRPNPLDHTYSLAREGATMFNYYLKIVPTLYANHHGDSSLAYQFSVTKHEKVITPGSGESGMPGVFFSYELSAMMVKIYRKFMPFSRLITEICSIIGGVWVVSMFIDSAFYKTSKILQKIDLGKAS